MFRLNVQHLIVNVFSFSVAFNLIIDLSNQFFYGVTGSQVVKVDWSGLTFYLCNKNRKNVNIHYIMYACIS